MPAAVTTRDDISVSRSDTTEDEARDYLASLAALLRLSASTIPLNGTESGSSTGHMSDLFPLNSDSTMKNYPALFVDENLLSMVGEDSFISNLIIEAARGVEDEDGIVVPSAAAIRTAIHILSIVRPSTSKLQPPEDCYCIRGGGLGIDWEKGLKRLSLVVHDGGQLSYLLVEETENPLRPRLEEFHYVGYSDVLSALNSLIQ